MFFDISKLRNIFIHIHIYIFNYVDGTFAPMYFDVRAVFTFNGAKLLLGLYSIFDIAPTKRIVDTDSRRNSFSKRRRDIKRVSYRKRNRSRTLYGRSIRTRDKYISWLGGEGNFRNTAVFVLNGEVRFVVLRLPRVCPKRSPRCTRFRHNNNATTKIRVVGVALFAIYTP